MLAGCKRHAQQGSGEPAGHETPAQALQHVYEPLSKTYKDWTDVYMPVTLSLQSPVKQSVSGRISMKRGEWIHLSLRVLGMEMASFMVDREQVWIVDKMHHAYVHENLQSLLSKYPLTVSDVQDCLLGQLFPPTRDFLTDNIEATVTDSEPPMLQSLIMAKDDGRYVRLSYADQAESPAGIVAGELVLEAVATGKPLSASIAWRLDKAEWNTGRELKFSRPNDTYEQIDISKILKIKS